MIIPAAQRISDTKEYYFATKLREIRERTARGEDIINLAIGSPDLPPEMKAVERLTFAATHTGNHAYQPYKGIPALRESFAYYYQERYQVSLDPDTEILPLIGSKEGIMHISMAFLNPGDQVLIPNPGYPAYASVSRIVGAEAIPYRLSAENQWLPDIAELSSMDLSRVKIMWLNYPHMPTGALANDEIFQQLIQLAREKGILLCHDNPYSMILNDQPKSILGYAGAKEVALELNSLSKSHNMAGWRVGVLSGSAAYINTVMKVKSNMDSGMFRPLQEAASEALRSSEEWYDQLNSIYRKRREKVWGIMEAIDCNYQKDQAGMFVWGKIPEAFQRGQEVSELLLDQAGIFLAPGFIFGSEGEQYIRISLCAKEERIEEALGRIQSIKIGNR